MTMKPKPHCLYTRSGLTVAALLLFTVVRIAYPGEEALKSSQIIPLAKTWAFDIDTTRVYPHSDIGAEVRLRVVDFQNGNALGAEPDPHRQFVRVRTRFWYDHWFSRGTRAMVKINNESWIFRKCESCESEFDEIIFENLYLELVKHSGHPVGIRIGRQDLFYGDGLLTCDGGPLDESRTSYVNGILLTSRIPLWTFDIFAAYSPETDEYLPRINNKHRQLIEHDEFLAGIMLKRLGEGNREMRYTLEPYYIYKQEIGASDSTSKIHTIGTRLSFPLWQSRFATELIYQAGKAPESGLPDSSMVLKPDLDGPQTISAYAATVRIGVDLDSPAPGGVTVGYIYLQGDERTTRNKYEGWNPILGRWPLWSELYIYTLAMEEDFHPMKQTLAYWQNLRAPYIDFSIEPYTNLVFKGRVMKLNADESIFFDPEIEGPLHRGNLFILKVSWKPRPDWSGHILFESFQPGDFYDPYFEALGVDGPKDASFFRIELQKSF